MLATSVINGQMPTLDGVVEPKKTSIGIVSNEDIFKDIISKRISEQGHASNFLALEQLANTNPQKFYVIDLWNFTRYTQLGNAIRDIRERSPDSELILLEPDTSIVMPELLPVKWIAKENVVPTYKRPIPTNLASDVGGITYEEKIRRFIESEIIKYINKHLSTPSVAKIGGSLFDMYPSRPEALNLLVGEAVRLHYEGYPIILVPGGGPRKDADTGISKALGIDADPLSVFERQAMTLIQLLGGVGRYIKPGEVKDYDFREAVGQSIPIVSLVGSTDIPPDQSDAHSLELGEVVKSYKVIFVKNTLGIYKWDPEIDEGLHQARPWYSTATRLFAEGNKFYPTIHAREVASGAIDRTGRDGRGEHLIETLALLNLKDKTKYVRTVQVIDGKNPKLLRDALDGNFRASYKFPGSFILKG